MISASNYFQEDVLKNHEWAPVKLLCARFTQINFYLSIFHRMHTCIVLSWGHVVHSCLFVIFLVWKKVKQTKPIKCQTFYQIQWKYSLITLFFIQQNTLFISDVEFFLSYCKQFRITKEQTEKDRKRLCAREWGAGKENEKNPRIKMPIKPFSLAVTLGLLPGLLFFGPSTTDAMFTRWISSSGGNVN